MLVAIVMLKTFSGLPAVQHEKEYLPYLGWIQTIKPTSYLEIGAARGDTFHDTVALMPKGSRALAVDYPMQAWGLQDSRKYLERAVEDLRQKGYLVDVIFGNSQDSAVIEQVRKHDMFDLCFIDGDHTYKGVKADYDNYGLFAKYCAFHDISDRMKPNRKGELIEVPIFWNELKERNQNYLEWIDNSQLSPMGIGVIC